MAADLDSQMRTVLMQLALTSNGTTARMDADRGGGSARHYADVIPTGTRVEPYERLQDQYNAATTRAEREMILGKALELLDGIRVSRPPSTHFETLEEKQAWIIRHGEGLTLQEAAIQSYTGVKVVFAARIAAGREPDYGREPDPVRYESVAERRALVRKYAEQDMSAASIAKYLGLAYSTVLRDLGRKT